MEIRKGTIELIDIHWELERLYRADEALETRLRLLYQETQSQLIKKQIKKLLSVQCDIKYYYKDIKDFIVEWQKSYDEAIKSIAKK